MNTSVNTSMALWLSSPCLKATFWLHIEVLTGQVVPFGFIAICCIWIARWCLKFVNMRCLFKASYEVYVANFADFAQCIKLELIGSNHVRYYVLPTCWPSVGSLWYVTHWQLFIILLFIILLQCNFFVYINHDAYSRIYCCFITIDFTPLCTSWFICSKLIMVHLYERWWLKNS